MKVKIIVFPMLLALSVILFIWYIKPEYDQYQTLKSTLAAKETELSEIQVKKQKIAALSESLAAHESERQTVLRYLPEARNEEDIINAIDVLARSALISLLNVGIDSKSLGTRSPSDAAPGSFGTEISPILADSSAAGQYENIKGFLNQIYKTDKFSEISSLTISKAETPSGGGEAAASPSGTLTLQVSTIFGYLPKTGVDTNLSIYSKPESDYDYSIVKKISDLVKTPDIEIGPTGKANPFLP